MCAAQGRQGNEARPAQPTTIVVVMVKPRRCHYGNVVVEDNDDVDGGSVNLAGGCCVLMTGV